MSSQIGGFVAKGLAAYRASIYFGVIRHWGKVSPDVAATIVLGQRYRILTLHVLLRLSLGY